MRRFFIAGNWKMNMSPGEADLLARGLKRELLERQGVDLMVAPPYLSIPEVVSCLKATNVQVAAQNLHWEPSGAFTGEISAKMIASAGCQQVLIGHSERRQFFGETNQTVNRKIHAALQAGLLPMLCVGETLEERDAGRASEVVETQLEGALKDINDDSLAKISIAYEPVWAIGTGRTATPQQAQEMHARIRYWLSTRYEQGVVDSLRILYGGSVNPSNAQLLLSQTDIDGALVGGASLKVQSFVDIVDAALKARA